ncbi:MAG TPA: SDR family NAD(P)-dependent oxidoreductase [Rhodopila sp.]|jgi:3-oxoacyl-[acyl-carrier protein] reductase|nr:SDR family NAD(P)-dependent oxidoreductase [Rhodopila sp.]
MRNVVVTGGSRGLGLGIARTLADSGFQVVAVARNSSDGLAAAIADVAAGTQGALHFRPCDLADTASLPGLVKTLRAEFGPIYGLVNNAGIGTPGALATMKDRDIEALLRLNVLAPITLTKYVTRSMLAAGGGRIVNIASVVAATGYGGLAAYSASKAALVGFTRSLARELGPMGITVNAVAPGFVDTDMTHSLGPADRARIERRSALHRLPDVADVADMVAYLFSEKARNITGVTMTVDAGNTA